MKSFELFLCSFEGDARQGSGYFLRLVGLPGTLCLVFLSLLLSVYLQAVRFTYELLVLVFVASDALPLKHRFLFYFGFRALTSGHANALDFPFRFLTLQG